MFSAATAEASMSDQKRPPASGETNPRMKQDIEGRGPWQKVLSTVLPFSACWVVCVLGYGK